MKIFAFLFFLNVSNLYSQDLISENLYKEKARILIEEKKYDSALKFLNKVTSTRLKSYKISSLVEIYAGLDSFERLNKLLLQNCIYNKDLEYYSTLISNVSKKYFQSKQFKSIEPKLGIKPNYVQTSQLINALCEIDQFVRNDGVFIYNNETNYATDHYTFRTFYNYYTSHRYDFDTSEYINMQILLIHWSQFRPANDTVSELLDSLFSKKLINTNSYTWGKEIWFYQKNKMSYFGLRNINGMMGDKLPYDFAIPIWDVKNVNQRRRAVGLLDL